MNKHDARLRTCLHRWTLPRIEQAVTGPVRTPEDQGSACRKRQQRGASAPVCFGSAVTAAKCVHRDWAGAGGARCSPTAGMWLLGAGRVRCGARTSSVQSGRRLLADTRTKSRAVLEPQGAGRSPSSGAAKAHGWSGSRPRGPCSSTGILLKCRGILAESEFRKSRKYLLLHDLRVRHFKKK